jgi:hypothetical protein
MDDKIAVMHDILDKDGNLVKISAHEIDGEHIFDALWDERDKQTHENRQEFRKWVANMLRNKGYKTPH